MFIKIKRGGTNIRKKNSFDIKPQNVLLDMTGTVKICDLGIAKFVQMSAQGENLVTLTSAQGLVLLFGIIFYGVALVY